MASGPEPNLCHGDNNSLRKTDLEEFEYYPDASCYFALDAAVDLEVRPKVRKDADSKPDATAPLKVTLLRLVCTVKQYGSHKGSTAVDVWQMVVMDGSNALFKVVINSRESQDIPHEDLVPGTTIIVQSSDYKFIYMQDNDGLMRAVLFVDTFDFAVAPCADPDNKGDSTSTVTPEFATTWIDRSAVDFVFSKSVVQFMKCFVHEEGFTYWVPIGAREFEDGDFASCFPDKQMQWISRKRKSAVNENCNCVQLPYHFTNCILESIPLSGVDMEEVFHAEVKTRLKGRVHATKFSDLSSSHKRWCFYWYYAVNYFHLGGHDATELPSCFVTAVRNKHPDEEGHYKGFLSKERRQEQSLEQM
jgi:hypothetical protein